MTDAAGNPQFMSLNPGATTGYTTLSGTTLNATFCQSNNINTDGGSTTIGQWNATSNNDITAHAHRFIYRHPTMNKGIWLQGNTIYAIIGANSTTTLTVGNALNVNGHLEVNSSTDVNGHFYAHKLFTDTPGVFNEGGGTWDLTWNPADGSISREGSSLRYKENVKKAEVDFEKILDLEVKHYNMREGMGTKGAWVMGVIAEEAHELGLKDLVIYSKIDGQVVPDGIMYKKMGLYLLEIAKKQKQTIENQETELATLRSEVDALKAQLDRIEATLAKHN